MDGRPIHERNEHDVESTEADVDDRLQAATDAWRSLLVRAGIVLIAVTVYTTAVGAVLIR